MSYSPGEKMEIIRMVENSPLSVKQTLQQLKVSKSSFYDWYRRYSAKGIDGLKNHHKMPNKIWNRIPDMQREMVVETAIELPDKTCRQLAVHITDHEGYFVSESSVYRILKARGLVKDRVFKVVVAADKFADPTTRINQLWQTDFTYFRIILWGWYYLCTVMDDFSRYILAWRLCRNMKAEDIKATLDIAIQKTGISDVPFRFRTGLLSDNGPAFVSRELKTYLDEQNMWHTRGKPYHPQTQGKIERYHLSMKNVILLNNYYSVEELEKAIAQWVHEYNNQRYHESLNNVTPADMYFGRADDILKRREEIKKQTMLERRMMNRLNLIDNRKILY